MPLFESLLKDARTRLNLSREKFAALVGIKADYLADLEGGRQGNKKSPSLKTLKALVQIASSRTLDQALQLAAHVQDADFPWLTVDRVRAMELILAALDIDATDFRELGDTLDDEFDLQEAAVDGPVDYWVVSDALAESESSTFARRTANNIQINKATYRYFIPFDNQDITWQGAIDNIRVHLDEERLRSSLRVYKVSSLAFGCRVRISAPLTAKTKGVYNIGGSATTAAVFRTMPPDRLVALTNWLNLLCREADKTDSLEADIHDIGRAKRVYPGSNIH
jgi:transcriptional regulator with XRE-family HTH domain